MDRKSVHTQGSTFRRDHPYIVNAFTSRNEIVASMDCFFAEKLIKYHSAPDAGLLLETP